MSIAICDPGLTSLKVYELVLIFKPARNASAIKQDNSETEHHPCFDNIQKQYNKSAFALGRELHTPLHKARCAAYSVFIICSNNGCIKQLLIFRTGPSFKEKEPSTGKEGDALGKSGHVSFPPVAATKMPALALGTVACARGAHFIFEMLNYSVCNFSSLQTTTNNMLVLIHLHY